MRVTFRSNIEGMGIERRMASFRKMILFRINWGDVTLYLKFFKCMMHRGTIVTFIGSNLLDLQIELFFFALLTAR
jgi:hypothetical protein